jgi:protein-tyrosine-phosphatase
VEELSDAERATVRTIVDRVALDVVGVFSVPTIERFVAESFVSLAHAATVTTYLPLLTERFVRERLRALAQAEGVTVSGVPEVLFICVHNAGRSQMAAALVDHHAQGRVHVRSAGSAPAGEVNPAVVEAMAEWGIDISKEFPKPLTDEFARAADVLVTMGCGDACPVYPGKRYLDWELPDPAGKGVDAVRPIRDEIDQRVRTLLSALLATSS